mgnify:CR=1 FL=1
MDAIDRAKLLEWTRANLCPLCERVIGIGLEYGAFDIKPPEVPEPEWREQKLKNGWAQYRIDKLEKVETHD